METISKNIPSKTKGNFGFSISLYETTLAIGAMAEESDAGDRGSGSVYIYQLKDNKWTESKKLTPFDSQRFGGFGSSVALSENIMAIGSFGESRFIGAAYIYELKDDNWKYIQKINGQKDNGMFGINQLYQKITH